MPRTRWFLVGAIAALASAGGAQESPRFATLTAQRVLVVPAQEVTGAAPPREWLSKFDSLLTARLEAGGIGTGWAYAADAYRFSRQNPTYVADPTIMGVQPLKSDRIKAGSPLPEPFATRIRPISAVANARVALVPIVARLDSTVTPRMARLTVAIVDGRLATLTWIGTLVSKYAGGPDAAADSLATLAAGLFVAR